MVKYSPGSGELLAFSEQRGYVHVLDARTYEYREKLHLADTALSSAAESVAVPYTREARAVRERMPDTRAAWTRSDPPEAGIGDEDGEDGAEYSDPVNVRTRALADAAIRRGGVAPGSATATAGPYARTGTATAALLGAPPRPSSAAARDAGRAARDARMREILAQLPSLPLNLRPSASSSGAGGGVDARRHGHDSGERGRGQQWVGTPNPWDTFMSDDESRGEYGTSGRGAGRRAVSRASAPPASTATTAGRSSMHLDHADGSDPDDEDEAVQTAAAYYWHGRYEYDEEEEEEEELEEEADGDVDGDGDDEDFYRQILEAGEREEHELQLEQARAVTAAAGTSVQPDEWCPVLLDTLAADSLPTSPPPLVGDMRAPARVGQQQQQQQQALALPFGMFPSPVLSGARSSSSSRVLGAASASRQGETLTVSRLLGALAQPDGGVSSLLATGAAGGGCSTTGLDWDPTGRYLYASLERVVLEWEVNEEGRRCLPSAGML